ncbi:MAG: hypothetical protein Q9203_004180 [Teloschistes exilis]
MEESRLVYLHCSSIFSGAHAQVRKAKKISQLLAKHKASIKILTKEFTLAAIAAVVKELLEGRVFESSARAKLRYSELFQPSGSREAGRAASEAEIPRIEAEAAQDINPTSEDEEGPDIEKDAEHEAVGLQQSTSQAHQALSIPRLDPVYLPFKAQRDILILVRSLLEECCFEFGNTWVPDLMEAQVVKFTNPLPPAAIKPISGKTIADVLFGTNILRHSAVHRKPTSGGGIVQMLDAAVTFADALNDSRRAEKIAEIKVQLEASIEEIAQHQNLLECKLTDQLREIADRRAELDELERSSIQEMQVADKQQRSSVGASIEHVLLRARQTSNPRACSHGSSFDGAKAESEADEIIESSRIATVNCIRKDSDVLSIRERSPRSDWAYYPSEEPVRDDQFHEHSRGDSSIEEELGVSKWTPPIKRSKGKMKEENEAAVFGWRLSALAEVPCEVAKEAEPAEESYFVGPERAFPDEERSRQNPFREDVPPTEQALSAKEEPLPGDITRAEEPIWPEVSDDPFDPTPAPGFDPIDPTSAEDADVLASPPEPASAAADHESGLHPSSPSAMSTTVPPVLAAAAPETAAEDDYTIMLRILAGSRIRRCVVSIKACTRTAILNRARVFCVKCKQEDQEWAMLLEERLNQVCPPPIAATATIS